MTATSATEHAFITVQGLIARTPSWFIETVELIWHLLAALGLVAIYFRARTKATIDLELRLPLVAAIAILLIHAVLRLCVKRLTKTV